MRCGFSVLGSILSVIPCAALAACGGTTSGSGNGAGSGGGNGGGGNPSPAVTMQQGQWEFSVNNGEYFVETNLTDTSGQVTSTVFNTAVFNPGQATAFDPPGVNCVNVGLSATISNDTLTGALDSGGTSDMNFSGTLNSAGQSVSNGTSSAPAGGCTPAGISGGTFTGYAVPSLTGTYAGQITTWPSGSSPLSFTLTLTQSPDFSIAGSGLITGQGLVENITLPSSPTGSSVYSGVIGATFALQGTWTNATQSQAIQVTGHLSSNSTQIMVNVATGLCSACITVWQTGTLTKQ
jgi:hypothetical protein